jgi:hypothetical protein
MERTTIALAGLALVTGLGCRVPLDRLVEQRAYDEALCAASMSRDSDGTLVSLGPKLDADARPRLHLHAVPRAELERSLGEAGRRIADQAVLVRAVVAIDGVQVDDLGVRVMLVETGRPALAMPASVSVLAKLVGETATLDEPFWHIDGDRFWQVPMLGIPSPYMEASTLFVLPSKVVNGHSPKIPDRTTTLPTEVREQAPVAAMLVEQAALLSYARAGEAPETAGVWLWQRPSGDEVRLFVEWSYATYRCVGHKPTLLQRARRLDPVVVSGTIDIPLPPGDDLESRLNAAFGDRMRLLGP